MTQSVDRSVTAQPFAGRKAVVDAGSGVPRVRRVLVISHVNDSGYRNGGSVYTRSLLELVNIGYPGVESELVCFTGQASALVRRFRQAKALTHASLSRLPSKVHYFRSRAFAKKVVEKVSAGKYDLIILDHAEMLWCLEVIPQNIAVLAVAHNIESRLYEQFYRHRPILRRLFGHDVHKYHRFETERLARVRNIVAISGEDAGALREAIQGLNVLVVPPTFSYSPVVRTSELHQPLRVGLLGNFGWWPNREAYGWFVDHVWRHIGGDRELHVFGAHSTTLRGAARTTLHGFVDDISDVWQGVDLMINPIVSGSGVNVKVAEAIYNGMPMLCTPMAVAGLLTQVDPAIVVLEQADQWIRILGGDGAIALAQQEPTSATRMHVAASTHAKSLATFIDRVIGEVDSYG